MVSTLELLSLLLTPVSVLDPLHLLIGFPGASNSWNGETGTYCLEDIFTGIEGIRYTQVEEGEDEVVEMALNNINLSILKLSALITSSPASPSLGCLSSDTVFRVFNSAQISYNPYLYSPSMNYHTAETTLGMASVLFSGGGGEEDKKRIVY